MNHEEAVRRLDEFVDGRLSPAGSRALEGHLASCPECREELKRLGRILDGASGLRDRAIRPERDLWPGILARLEGEPTRATATGASAGGAGQDDGPRAAGLESLRGFSAPPERSGEQGSIRSRLARLIGASDIFPRISPRLSVRLAWSAAVVLIVASTLAIFVRSRGLTWPQGALDPTVAQSISLMESEASKARSDFSAALSANGDRSPEGPESEFEKNLEVLDQAIRDSRAALAASPQDRGLQRSLLGVYQKQLDLLRWAARVMQQTS